MKGGRGDRRSVSRKLLNVLHDENVYILSLVGPFVPCIDPILTKVGYTFHLSKESLEFGVPDSASTGEAESPLRRSEMD